MKRSFLTLALLLPLLAAGKTSPAGGPRAAAQAKAAARPNIVIIMADDLDSRQLGPGPPAYPTGDPPARPGVL